MNVLIITTYYPPDSAVAAVRPYMFAKYLTQFGHHVTVLRSGELFRKPDWSLPALKETRVISYLGEDSPVEAFERGEEITVPTSIPTSKSRLAFLPSTIRLPIAWVYHACIDLGGFRQLAQWKRHSEKMFTRQKQALHALKMEDKSFDIVFSTYANLENVFAGEYAASLFSCPWILDLRDPIAHSFFKHGPTLIYLKRFQDRAVSRADACTVISDGLRESSRGLRESSKTVTLYNGYEPFQDDGGGTPESGIFSLCYTGMLYNGQRDATPLLEALKHLSDEGKIDLDRVRIHYAGPDFHCMLQDAEALDMEACLMNHGYVTRAEASHMQKSADIFLMLSWNTKESQGVISGKFYEGIRCGRPILSLVSGNIPNSELYQINKQYQYGFCYEAARRQEHFPLLRDFLLQAYRQKLERGIVDYTPSKELSTVFRYDTLTRQLETLCQKLIREKTKISE